MVLQQVFEEHNRKVLFKNSHANFIKPDLKNIILLDIKSTKELFCNTNLVGDIYKAKKQLASE